jgi:hypothetical protein
LHGKVKDLKKMKDYGTFLKEQFPDYKLQEIGYTDND